MKSLSILLRLFISSGLAARYGLETLAISRYAKKEKTYQTIGDMHLSNSFRKSPNKTRAHRHKWPLISLLKGPNHADITPTSDKPEVFMLEKFFSLVVLNP